MILHPTGRFDNAPDDNREIEARPLAAAMGAEILGVRLAALTDAQFAEVRAALFRHKMIYFRDQTLSHAEHERFSLRFGPFAPNAYARGLEGHPDIQPVIREANERPGMIFGSGWHTDSPFLPAPPSITMLRAVEVPPWGGDTLWANAALAWATLSDAMKTLLAPLKVRMSMRGVLETAKAHQAPDETPLGRLAAAAGEGQPPPEIARKIKGAGHPLVRAHPVTGEMALYCDETYAAGIDGFTPEEASPLLKFLAGHITQPAFTCRLRWEAGTVALWDNRLCLHQAFNDTDGRRREFYRTTVAGEPPG